MRNKIKNILKEQYEYIDKITGLLLSDDKTNQELGFYLMKYNDIPMEPVIDELINNFIIKDDEIPKLQENIYNLEPDDFLNMINFMNDWLKIDFTVYADLTISSGIHDDFEEEDITYSFNWEIGIGEDGFNDYHHTMQDISETILNFNYILKHKVKIQFLKYFNQKLNEL